MSSVLLRKLFATVEATLDPNLDIGEKTTRRQTLLNVFTTTLALAWLHHRMIQKALVQMVTKEFFALIVRQVIQQMEIISAKSAQTLLSM